MSGSGDLGDEVATRHPVPSPRLLQPDNLIGSEEASPDESSDPTYPSPEEGGFERRAPNAPFNPPSQFDLELSGSGRRLRPNRRDYSLASRSQAGKIGKPPPSLPKAN